LKVPVTQLYSYEFHTLDDVIKVDIVQEDVDNRDTPALLSNGFQVLDTLETQVSPIGCIDPDSPSGRRPMTEGIYVDRQDQPPVMVKTGKLVQVPTTSHHAVLSARGAEPIVIGGTSRVKGGWFFYWSDFHKQSLYRSDDPGKQ